MESDCKQGSEAKIELMEQKRLQLSHFESKKKKSQQATLHSLHKRTQWSKQK